MKRRNLRIRGALLIDVLLSVFVLSLAGLSFVALMPVINRSKAIGKEESVAQQMCQRMLEQLQLLRPTDINYDTLRSLNLIDRYPGTSPYSFSSMPMDDASKYSPAQALRGGTGTMNIVSLANNSVRVEITIGWTSSNGKAREVKTGTILGGYR